MQNNVTINLRIPAPIFVAPTPALSVTDRIFGVLLRIIFLRKPMQVLFYF